MLYLCQHAYHGCLAEDIIKNLCCYVIWSTRPSKWSHWLQYIPRNMHTVFALLCFVVVIHWLMFPYPSGLLHWHCGNLTIAPVPAKQPWWIWINTSCEYIMNDCVTTTKQSTTKPCAYFLGYTVSDITWRHGTLSTQIQTNGLLLISFKPSLELKLINYHITLTS